MKTTVINILKWIGLGFFEPIIRLASGEDKKKNITQILKKIVFPVIAILLFIILWSSFANKLRAIKIDERLTKIETEQGKEEADRILALIEEGIPAEQPQTLPTPTQVNDAYKSLFSEHKRIAKEKREFVTKMKPLNAQRVKQGLNTIEYTGQRSFVDQIYTSLWTVFCGFLLACVIAVPLGVVMGLSETIRDAVNPFVQIFKPVSPVVWYLLVYMIVTTLVGNGSDNKAFIISFVSVGLCAMWATLVNTAVGVSSVDKDIINVSKVLKLSTFQHVFKVILPASIPMIFTGLRITMSVSWMVLIAIELLSQSPGLGTFVWEKYQGGASDAYSKIIAAMFVIGGIGFLLDRVMMILQNLVSFQDEVKG